ncbi:MAG: hypothetical protein EU548_09580 [Promethearchaeota archaeon]|nr:MAG: hypothetical protein EU548_09580 [Candidatus Lokiarchaeota archaeon]
MLIGAFFFSQTSIIYTNNDKERDISLKNYRPKSSGTMINITTPENKTYIGPMSGYYPATYGFENDADGTVPIGWDDYSAGTTTSLIESDPLDGHKNYIKMNDNDGTAICEIRNSFSSQENGTVELWIRSNDVTDLTRVTLVNASDISIVRIKFDLDNIQNLDGAWNTFYSSPVDDTWYRLRIDFECGDGGYLGLSADTYNVYVYDTSGIELGKAENAAFSSDTTGISYLSPTTHQGDSDYISYIDAVGYYWDDNYNIGDNEEEGLFLSFKKGTTLDWIGYSLDGQDNKTIFGNNTIPLPTEGLHNIQVFGNDSLGTMYQSDVRNFSIDINPPTSSISFTPYSGINQVNRTTNFTLSADDGLGSGVSAIMYKINESGWIVYNTPFNLSVLVLGQYNISFYAFDLVGHIENINSLIVELVDAYAPISWISFIPHSGIIKVNRTTNFTLFAYDAYGGLGSGVSAIMYKIDDSGWIEYSIPFNLSGFAPGQHNISFYAFDLAGNNEIINSLIVELVKKDTGGIIPGDDDDDDDDNDDVDILVPILIGFGIASAIAIAGIAIILMRKRKLKRT